MSELTLYTCITSALQKWVGGKSLLTDIPHIPPRSTCLFRPLKNKNSISTYNKYYCLPVSAQASYSEGHGSAAVGHSLYGGLACGQGHGQSVPYTPPPPHITKVMVWPSLVQNHRQGGCPCLISLSYWNNFTTLGLLYGS